MFILLWKWLVSLFTVDKIGILVRYMLLSSGTVIMKQILDVQNQQKAYEFVNELNSRTDLTGLQKAKIFNEKMLIWAKSVGKEIVESQLNCLRELAVSALKAEKTKGN